MCQGVLPPPLPNWKSVSQSLDHIVIKELEFDHNKTTNAVDFQHTEKPSPSAGSSSSIPSGSGTLLCIDGHMYTGEYEDLKPHGNGSLMYKDTSRYDGQFEKGFFSGKGRYQLKPYEDGECSTYTGEWWMGKPHGVGKATFQSSKVVYDGEWLDGRPHGTGSLTDFTVSIFNERPYQYSGTWRNGKPHGTNGKQHFPDGSTFCGTFVDGIRNGFGTLSSGDGQYKYEGQWIYGKRHGFGVEHTRDGNIFEGDFVKDKRKGMGKIFYPDGEVFEDYFMGPKITDS